MQQELAAPQASRTSSQAELDKATTELRSLKQALQEKDNEVLEVTQAHARQLAIKENQLKATTVAQELTKRRLQQAEETINEFLANPIAGTLDESAKDAEIKALKKQVETDNLIKATMVSGWVAREAAKDREMEELKEQLKKLKAELTEKDNQLQARNLQFPIDPILVEPISFEPLDDEIPSTSAHIGEDTEDVDTDIPASEPSTADPQEADIEKELKLRIQGEVDHTVKSCMEWELKVLHSACIHYLTAGNIQKEYHMPTLPYLLLKKEVQQLKEKYLPECPTNELGGYEQVPIEDHQVAAIQLNQPPWRVSWLAKYPRNKLHYLAAP